ncbi:MAG TPA: TerB family tellurite resistance protein [Labilithrix sp.]|nr:TerB family tellurite resistance protein [Labilithrix sp.]
MIWLSNSTLGRLRDQLQHRGQRPSLIAAPDMSPDDAELMNITAEYGPLCEAMYLMMSADGKIGKDEREVLKGALRNLSGDIIRSVHIDAMLDEAGKNVAEQGRAARLQEIVVQLHDDRARAEVAFVLAAAIAFADNAIADEENETLNEFAEGLGIDEGRANQLLDEVEADLSGQRLTPTT